MASTFTLLHLAINVYTRPEERRLQLKLNRDDAPVEVKTGAGHIRFGFGRA